MPPFPRSPRRSGREIPQSAILIEMYYQGPWVKVTAMDQYTLTEVTVVGDATRNESELKELASRKLRYVLDRKAQRDAERGRGRR